MLLIFLPDANIAAELDRWSYSRRAASAYTGLDLAGSIAETSWEAPQ